MKQSLDQYVWVTCSRDTNYTVAGNRHLVRAGWQKRDWVTTVCGSTGNPFAWRSNSNKAKCPTCLERTGNS